MNDRYQRTTQKSKPNFEVVDRWERVVQLPLPVLEAVEQLQPEVERWAAEAGLKILRGLLEDEVTRRVGPPHHPGPGGWRSRFVGAALFAPFSKGCGSFRGRFHSHESIRIIPVSPFGGWRNRFVGVTCSLKSAHQHI